MDILTNIVKVINEYLWNYGLLFLLCGTGLYFTIRLKFILIILSSKLHVRQCLLFFP